MERDERFQATSFLLSRAYPDASWSHARRKVFALADIASKAKKGKPDAVLSPLAFEAVKRIDEPFGIEREITGLGVEERLADRAERSRPLLADLEAWMRAEHVRLSRHAPVDKAMDYLLKRWPGFTRFLDDRRICLSNDAAERALCGSALGRKYAQPPIMCSSMLTVAVGAGVRKLGSRGQSEARCT